jgi:hypothetical protein
MKPFNDMFKESIDEKTLLEGKSIADKLASGEKIDKDDFTSYRNAMNEAFGFNKMFDKFVDTVRRNKIFNNEEMKILEAANKLLKFTGKTPIALAKDLIKD